MLTFQTVKDKHRGGSKVISFGKPEQDSVKKEDLSKSSITNEIGDEEYCEVKLDTMHHKQSHFAIQEIHELSLDKIDETFILEKCCDPDLLKLELYFLADLTFHMNFQCKCTNLS